MPSVLIVDDSRMSRLLIGAIVKQVYPDAEIVEAEAGEEALEKTAGKRVDVATIDLNMPGMDAFDLIAALRARCPDAKLGLLTANVQEAVQTRARELGLGFISKPITEASVTAFLTAP